MVPRTEVIDVGGRTLLPGLIDSHFHLLWGSLKLDKLRLEDADTLPEVVAALADYAAANPRAARGSRVCSSSTT